MIDQLHVRSSERGFTLAELLVAMTLTLVVLTGTFGVLQEAARSSGQAAAVTEVNQSIRVAMNVVIRDLIQAGEGDYSLRTGVPIPGGVGAEQIVRPSPAGANWFFPSTYTVLPAVSPADGIGAVVNGIRTDVVTLLYEDRRLDFSGLLPDIPAAGDSMTFPNGFGIADEAIGLKEGDLIRFGSGAMQQITRVTGQTIHFDDDATSHFNQRGAPQGSVMEMSGGGGNNFPDLPISRVFMITYYVTIPDGGIPQLVRRVNYGDERVVAVGIENFQLSWDLVDGVNNPTNVEAFGDDTAEGQIRKANLYLAARSQSAAAAANGQPLRASLATQVSLRSMAFVSRYDVGQ